MKVLPAAVLLLLVTAAAARAHDTWLSPSTYSAKPGEPVSFDLTSGMEFPKLETGPKPERVERSGYRVGSETGELKTGTAGEKALRLEQAFGTPGVAIVWVQLHPREIEMSDADVAHYFEEIRASAEIEQAWAAQKGKQKWKELYAKCAKTFVAVGNPSAADESWKQPVGLTLELVPSQNPTTIRAGETAKFQLLRNGAPLPHAQVALHRGGGKPEFRVTGEDGAVEFKIAAPGPVLLTNVQLHPPADPAQPWQSEFTTVTFEVQR
ncbi:MAG: DUF4198 domain-containing protein [Chthoniobacterales bacterium]|nr:DUF4198 domain-containing protein [Chthoniobacterales bacterium]